MKKESAKLSPYPDLPENPLNGYAYFKKKVTLNRTAFIDLADTKWPPQSC